MRWTGDYAAKVKNGSHWETMRTLLGRVWRRAQGSLSHGEMSVIFDQIDATDGGYFRSTHGLDRKDELIRFIMTRR